MDITIPALDFTFSIGLANILSFVLGIVLMFLFDRWVLGRRVRTDLKNVRTDLEEANKKNVAHEARISTLERSRQYFPTDLTHPAHLPSDSSEKIKAPDKLNVPLQVRPDGTLFSDSETWLTSPGAGRATAEMIMKSPTIKDARRVYDAHRAAQSRIDKGIANWAILYRMEIEGLGQEVYALAYDLTGEDEEIAINDYELQNELRRIYAETRNLSDGELKVQEASDIVRHIKKENENG